jgi:hypothetical protein
MSRICAMCGEQVNTNRHAPPGREAIVDSEQAYRAGPANPPELQYPLPLADRFRLGITLGRAAETGAWIAIGRVLAGLLLGILIASLFAA